MCMFYNLNILPTLLDCKSTSAKSFSKNSRLLLAQFFQAKLAAFLVDGSNLNEVLTILSMLQTVVKKLDDKLLLVEINLIESRARYLLCNMNKH
eukprot:maker-scaffold_8-snap-gene-11.38-mRNA-1 protein AED:0.45 eAED:0.55 QI:0/0/0/1/0/0/2/0/93